jgi:CDP-6-deoxy-D-xylo-4-hexulose-3-dehydrase
MAFENVIEEVKEWYNNKPKENWRAGKDWVHYAGPYFTEDEYIKSIISLLNGWLVLGAEAIKCEKKLSKIFNKNFGLLTNSGSSSNLLMMSALKSKRSYNFPDGTKVLTPIAGFPTTINPIFQNNFVPVFVDIDLSKLNLDLDDVEKKLKENPDIKVITFAHVLGNPPNMSRLLQIIDKYDLILLEDCCDALGSTYGGKPLGSFGEMASCSFYPAHHITCGEGGFVACNDSNIEKVVRSLRDWGRGCFCQGKQNISACGACNKRFSNWLPMFEDEIFDHKYVYEEIGYNLKPIELQASMLLAQLDKFETIKSLRQRNYKLLFDIFSKYEDYFILPIAEKHSDVNWFAFPLTIKDNSPFKRSDLCQYFESNKIQTRPYFAGNILMQPAYSHLVRDTSLSDFPVAKKITTDTFFLGTSPVITPEQISYIGEVLNSFFQK